MSEPAGEQVHKTENLKLVAFLLSRGCFVKEATLRSDNRVDFVIAGDNISELVREHRMCSPNTLVQVHSYDSKTEFARDEITRLRKEALAQRRC